MSVPACLQSFCIFGLKCSVVNPEAGMERSGSRQPVVVFLPGGGKKRAQPYCSEPSSLYLPQNVSVLYCAFRVIPLQPVGNSSAASCSCGGWSRD